MRKSAGGGDTSGAIYLVFIFKLVAVKTMAWSYDDESPKETVTFEYGGLQIHYRPQSPDGSFQGEIAGGLEQSQKHQRHGKQRKLWRWRAYQVVPWISRAALQSGDVRSAMDLLKSEVRRAPRDVRLRIFLFQLFCITGEWDRALTQLSVLGELDAGTSAMVQTYQVAIRCEVLRAKVFAGQRSPTVLGDPGEWLPLLIEATRLLASGEPQRAAQLRDAAFETAPPSAAMVNGTAHDWLADADPRLGPATEAIIDGKYVWIPYERIRTITFDPPPICGTRFGCPPNSPGTMPGQRSASFPPAIPARPAALTRRCCSRGGRSGWKPRTGPSRLASGCW